MARVQLFLRVYLERSAMVIPASTSLCSVCPRMVKEKRIEIFRGILYVSSFPVARILMCPFLRTVIWALPRFSTGNALFLYIVPASCSFMAFSMKAVLISAGMLITDGVGVMGVGGVAGGVSVAFMERFVHPLRVQIIIIVKKVIIMRIYGI